MPYCMGCRGHPVEGNVRSHFELSGDPKIRSFYLEGWLGVNGKAALCGTFSCYKCAMQSYSKLYARAHKSGVEFYLYLNHPRSHTAGVLRRVC